MPPRSSLLQLPEDLRRELNARLVSQGFADYDALETWLADELQKRDLDVRVSRSAIHRHGQKFEEKLDKIRIATSQARAISDGAEDDEGSMNDALIRLVQTKTFEILLELDEDEQKINLPKIGMMIARLTRASVNQKKWKQDYSEQIESKKQEAVETVDSLTKGGELPADVAATIRAQILGIKLNG